MNEADIDVTSINTISSDKTGSCRFGAIASSIVEQLLTNKTIVSYATAVTNDDPSVTEKPS